MMDLKAKYRMYVIAAFVSAVAITAAIAMQLYAQPVPLEADIKSNVALPDSTWYIQASFIRALEVEGTLMPDVSLNSDSGKVSLMKTITQPTLIFRYFDTNCADCIKKEADLIKQCIEANFTKVLFIGSFQNYRSMRAFNISNGIQWSSLQLGLEQYLEWEPDAQQAPYYFVLYPSGRTSHFFMAMPEFIAYTRKYLHGMNRLLSQ